MLWRRQTEWGSNDGIYLPDVILAISKLKAFADDKFNPFPHNKILDQTKLKAFAGDKLNVTKMIISVCDRAENIVAKGEIACTSNFFFSHNVFKRLLSQTHQRCHCVGMG